MATAAAKATARSTRGGKRSGGIPERRLGWLMVSPSMLLIALVAA